jgi:O-antigen/teichoic acid export membrane protein
MTEPSARREAGHHHASAVAATGALGALLGFVLAPEILSVVYGDAFVPAAPVLRILMANLLFAYAVEVFHTQLVAWRLQTQQMWMMIAGTILNIALNAVLIPRYGIDGAAVATLASTLMVGLLAVLMLHRHGYEIHAGTLSRAGLIAIVLAALGMLVLDDVAIGNALVRIVIVGAVLSVLYGGATWLTGALRPAETFAYLSRRG